MKEEIKKYNFPEDIQRYLVDHNIKPSIHRIAIAKFLWNNTSHPTVDDIYKALHPDIPTLSKTTVYNTMALFQEKHIVRVLKIDETELRYDFNTHPHIHFKCVKCGRIFDVEMKETDKIPISGMVNEHTILECHIYLDGICKECKNKN